MELRPDLEGAAKGLE